MANKKLRATPAAEASKPPPSTPQDDLFAQIRAAGRSKLKTTPAAAAKAPAAPLNPLAAEILSTQLKDGPKKFKNVRCLRCPRLRR